MTPPELLTVDQVREIIPLSKHTLYRMAETGEIECVRMYRKVFFTREGAERFIRDHFFPLKRNHLGGKPCAPSARE